MFSTGPKNPKFGNFSILASESFDGVSDGKKSIAMKTGYTYFDLPTGYKDYEIGTGLILPNGGFQPKVYSCIGESGSGKTTIMLQCAGAIVDNYWGGNLIVMDAEMNTPPERIMSVCGWTKEEYHQKCKHIPSYPSMTINDVYNMIRRTAHSKEAAGEGLKISVPYEEGNTGECVVMYPPTVIIVDSIPSLAFSGGVEDKINTKNPFQATEEIASVTEGMREANQHTQFLKKAKAYLPEYNIILIAVNHITTQITTGRFDKPKKFHPDLKPGEKTAGGKEWIYQSFGLPRLTPREKIDDYKPIYGDEVRGNIVDFTMVKNKANVSAKNYRIVFDKRTGFRPELTDFEYLFTVKFGLSGSPAAMYLDILPEIKFTRKNLLNKCREEPLLSRAIAFTAKYHLSNEMIIPGEYPIVDFKGYQWLPVHVRINMILSSTVPYPKYRKMNGEYDRKLNACIQAAYLSRHYTGMSPDHYIHPSNIVRIDEAVMHLEDGFCGNIEQKPLTIKAGIISGDIVSKNK